MSSLSSVTPAVHMRGLSPGECACPTPAHHGSPLGLLLIVESVARKVCPLHWQRGGCHRNGACLEQKLAASMFRQSIIQTKILSVREFICKLCYLSCLLKGLLAGKER